MKNKIVAFTSFDKANGKFFPSLLNSWNKFHPDIEIKVYDEEKIKTFNDPYFFYRQKPLIARELLKEYDTVIGLDVDQIITGDLSHTWAEDFDVAVVQNSNPREMKRYPVSVWDIVPMTYVNCGYVVMKSPQFVEHWYHLCMSPHFDAYQFKEQDLLNIMVYYCGYSISFLDSGNKWHGLASKGYWANIELKQRVEDGFGETPDPKSKENPYLVLPKASEWPQSGDKEICIIHWAGGNEPNKMNYRTRFKEEVVKHLDYLTNEKT